MEKMSLFILCAIVVAAGCSTPEGRDAAIGGGAGAVIGGIIGHQTDNDLAGAGIGAAVGAVGGAVVGSMAEKKFCPTCGKQYSGDTKFCPIDGVELKDVQK